MEIEYHADALLHREYWLKSGNVKVQRRITQLISSIMETLFKGIGKPEPLKHRYRGFWSRRITHEHRLVYQVDENTLKIVSMKGHYE